MTDCLLYSTRDETVVMKPTDALQIDSGVRILILRFLILQAILNTIHTFQNKHSVTAEDENGREIQPAVVLDPWGKTMKTYRRVALPMQVGRIEMEMMQGTPLHLATVTGNAVAVEALLRFGSDAEKTTGAHAPYNDAYFEKCTSDTYKMLERGESKLKTALHLVPEIQKGGGRIAEILVKHGAANIEVQDYKGWTPLIGAAVLGNVEVVGALIALGCDMDTMPDINQTKKEPQFAFWTALRHAVFNTQRGVIVVLMREGADPNCVATDKEKLDVYLEEEFDLHARAFLENKAPDQNDVATAFAAHFDKDVDSSAWKKYGKVDSTCEEINRASEQNFEATKASWLEARRNKRVANLMATMKRLRKKQTAMLPSQMLSDYEEDGPMKRDIDEHVMNMKEVGMSACLPYFLRDSNSNADAIAEALLTSTFDQSKRTRETLYSTNLLTLSDSFYLAVKCDEPEIADLVFKYAWTLKARVDAKRAQKKKTELLEKFKCWKLFLMILKDRVFDRESSFMVRACIRRNNDMVTVINALRTLVRSDLAIAASSLTTVLNAKLTKLREAESGVNGASNIHKVKHEDTAFDYLKLKDLVDQCDKDEEAHEAAEEAKHGKSVHHRSQWPRALVDVDGDMAYETMSYGRLQEGLDIIVSCQGLVEEFVFNFEAPPGSINAFSPLHQSCNAEEEMIETVQTLARAKVNVNAKGKYGLTPLHIACLRGHVRVVEELLAYNANSAVPTLSRHHGITMTGSDILMNTLNLHPEAVERVTALQMAVHPRHFFSATVGADQEETGAQRAQHGEVGVDQLDFTKVAERVVFNLGLDDYIRHAHISAAEAFNLAKHGAYERVKRLKNMKSSSLRNEEEMTSLETGIEHACNQQYMWRRWHNSARTLKEPKVPDKEKIKQLLGLGMYSFPRDKLSADSPTAEEEETEQTKLSKYIHGSSQVPVESASLPTEITAKSAKEVENELLDKFAPCLEGLCLLSKHCVCSKCCRCDWCIGKWADKDYPKHPNHKLMSDKNLSANNFKWCKVWTFRATTDDPTAQQDADDKMKSVDDYVNKYVERDGLRRQRNTNKTSTREEKREANIKAWRRATMFVMDGAIKAVLRRALTTPKCHLNIVKQLVEQGADKEHPNDAGQNALHMAYLNVKLDEDERAASPNNPFKDKEEDKTVKIRELLKRQEANIAKCDAEEEETTCTCKGHQKIKELKQELVEVKENEDNEGGALKFGLLSGPAAEVIRFLQRDTGLNDLEEVMDKNSNPPFTKPQVK